MCTIDKMDTFLKLWEPPLSRGRVDRDTIRFQIKLDL